MAYTPTDWECGQTVTAEKLNNIERGIAEVNSAYNPTTWECGDLITAEKMNKIEQGIANAGGGGSSDFSTAEISISGLSVSQCSVTSPHIITTPFDMIVADTAKYASGDIVTVALYKGKASISASVVGIGDITVSGDIESMGGDYYLVTGDCTITIS